MTGKHGCAPPRVLPYGESGHWPRAPVLGVFGVLPFRGERILRDGTPLGARPVMQVRHLDVRNGQIRLKLEQIQTPPRAQTLVAEVLGKVGLRGVEPLTSRLSGLCREASGRGAIFPWALIHNDLARLAIGRRVHCRPPASARVGTTVGTTTTLRPPARGSRVDYPVRNSSSFPFNCFRCCVTRYSITSAR